MKYTHILSLMFAVSIGSATAQTSTDLWDVSQGTVVTASSGTIPGYTIESMFGGVGPFSDWTYFSDAQPPGFVHFVEWETQANVNVARVQLFALGDGFFGFPNNEREFSHFTLRAKSPGSLIYDLTLIEYDATHPYAFVGPNFLLVDQIFAPVVAQSFRAEFTQFDTGSGFDGPRIIELEAFAPPPPVLTSQPQGIVVNHGMPAQFSVAATGAGTLTYQWFKDGTPISDQTGATFRIAAVTANDMGSYTVAVTDANGTTTSLPATLVIDFLNAVHPILNATFRMCYNARRLIFERCHISRTPFCNSAKVGAAVPAGRLWKVSRRGQSGSDLSARYQRILNAIF